VLVDPIEISRGASTAATFTSPFLHGPSFNSCNSNQDVVLRIVLHEGLRETGRGERLRSPCRKGWKIRQRLIFRTHAGCARSSSGKSGSSMLKPAFDDLNLSGKDEPSRPTELAASTSLTTRLCPDHCGRMA